MEKGDPLQLKLFQHLPGTAAQSPHLAALPTKEGSPLQVFSQIGFDAAMTAVGATTEVTQGSASAAPSPIFLTALRRVNLALSLGKKVGSSSR